ncbi:MAG: acyltransferase family protein [Pseudomonadota bacterium]|nr:acyltransferase family protein [Pseudomonadota bacterium]
MQRRHDIDALRVIAFGLLIFYHAGMAYVAEWDFHIKSAYLAEWLQWPMIAINRWRMPLLFVVSGVAIGLFLQPGRSRGRFLASRSWRLLLPLAFGMLFVVPVQAWCEAVANGAWDTGFGSFLRRYLHLQPWPEGGWTGASHGVTWNHLWYLAYLWAYTCVLALLLPLLESAAARRLRAWLPSPKGAWWVVGLAVVPVLYFFALLAWLAPLFPKTGALVDDWYQHAQYFPLFLAGCLVARNASAWTGLVRVRCLTLCIALAAISVELLLRAAGRHLPPGDVPAVLAQLPWHHIELAARALYMWTALLAIFGWARQLLDRPFRWLPYATEAVYPWYVLHQSLIVPLVFVLAPLQLGPVLEPVLVLAGTVAGCVLLHEFVIRRVALLRPLFGLKRQDPSRATPTIAMEATCSRSTPTSGSSLSARPSSPG